MPWNNAAIRGSLQLHMLATVLSARAARAQYAGNTCVGSSCVDPMCSVSKACSQGAIHALKLFWQKGSSRPGDLAIQNPASRFVKLAQIASSEISLHKTHAKLLRRIA